MGEYSQLYCNNSMVGYGNCSYDEHFVEYINIKSLCCAHETIMPTTFTKNSVAFKI